MSVTLLCVQASSYSFIEVLDVPDLQHCYSDSRTMPVALTYGVLFNVHQSQWGTKIKPPNSLSHVICARIGLHPGRFPGIRDSAQIIKVLGTWSQILQGAQSSSFPLISENLTNLCSYKVLFIHGSLCPLQRCVCVQYPHCIDQKTQRRGRDLPKTSWLPVLCPTH